MSLIPRKREAAFRTASDVRTESASSQLRRRRRHILVGFFAAAAVVLGGASASASPQDLTLSFDAEPAYSEWSSIQPGFKCANGSVDQSATAQSPSAAFVRDD